jgi:uncharacterized small protein (DUF1192 family)
MGENKMNERIGLGRMVGQPVAKPKTTKECSLDRLRVLSVRANELTNRVEVLQPILNSNYG